MVATRIFFGIVRKYISFLFTLRCKSKTYLKNLPSTSVIVIFYNEWPSILLRTIHSIYNRTPRELLKEIIIINDNSSKPELYEPLELYLRQNFDDRVKLKHLKERRGLIVARMEGVKVATGEVLVFLDAHMEVSHYNLLLRYFELLDRSNQVNTNWLPPLLEPIALSPTTVTTPVMDQLSSKTFHYRFVNITRAVFNDELWQGYIPVRQEDSDVYPEPHQVSLHLQYSPNLTLFLSLIDSNNARRWIRNS